MSISVTLIPVHLVAPSTRLVYIWSTLIWGVCFFLCLLVVREPESKHGSPGAQHSTIGGLYRAFWAPFAASYDYLLLGIARVFFYGSTAGVSLLLFFFRDCLSFTQADSRRVLATAALLSQGTIALISLPVGMMTDHDSASQTDRTATVASRKRLFIFGCLTSACATSTCLVVPTIAEFLPERTIELTLYVGALLYGAGSVLVGVADMSLTLDLVPAGIGNGAAMAVSAPSIAIGFCIGSILMTWCLSSSPVPTLHEKVVWEHTYEPVGYQKGELVVWEGEIRAVVW